MGNDYCCNTDLTFVRENLLAFLANIGPRTNPGSGKKAYGSGKETLRLRANGPARVEEAVSACRGRKRTLRKNMMITVFSYNPVKFQSSVVAFTAPHFSPLCSSMRMEQKGLKLISSLLQVQFFEVLL